MKIHEYNQMMAYLTRPSYVSGGRVGFKRGTPTKGNWMTKQELFDYLKVNDINISRETIG